MSFKAKTVLNKDIRVFKKDINNIGDAFEALKNFIKEKYELEAPFSIQYEDEEKDVITIASSEDLEEAYNQAETNSTVLKLLIVPDDIGVPVYSITTELDKSEINNNNNENNNENNNNNNDAEKKESDSSSSCSSSSDDENENGYENEKCVGKKLINDLINNKEFREEFINFITTFIVSLQDDMLKITSDTFTKSLNAHENVSQHPAMKKLVELFPTLISQFQPFLSFINTIDVENIEGLINNIINMFSNNNNNGGCHFRGAPPLIHMLMRFLRPFGGRNYGPPPPPPPFNPLANLFNIFIGGNDNIPPFGDNHHPHPHPPHHGFGHRHHHNKHHGPHHGPHHRGPHHHHHHGFEHHDSHNGPHRGPHSHPHPPPPHHGFGHRHGHHGHHEFGHHGHHEFGHHGFGRHGWFNNNNNNNCQNNFDKEDKCQWKRKHFGKCHGKWGRKLEKEQENIDYNVEIIKDNLTLSDKGYVLPGQLVVKTWLIKNNGKKDWPQGILLKYNGRPFNPIISGVTFSVPSLKIGEEGEVSVTIETPKEGSNYYGKQKAFFRLSLPDGTLFGSLFKIRLFIVTENEINNNNNNNNNNNSNSSEEEKDEQNNNNNKHCKKWFKQEKNHEKKKDKLLKEKAKLEEKVAKLDAKLAKQEEKLSKIQSDSNNNNNNNNDIDDDVKDTNLVQENQQQQQQQQQQAPSPSSNAPVLAQSEPAPILPFDNDAVAIDDNNEHEKDASSSSFSFSEVDHDIEENNKANNNNNNDEPVLVSNIKNESAKEPFKYEEQLNTLIGMGFNNIDKICRLLNENNGNVDAVINLLC